MLRTNACVARRSSLCWWLAGAIAGIPVSTACGQFQQAVGGISIDATGVLSNAEKDFNGLRQFWLDNLQKIPGDLNQPTKLRKISLRAINEALVEIVSGGKRVPDDLRFLAGLQRVEYVLVYPEGKDIVLAGYAEGWKIDARGNMVGAKNGRPLMQLDDLLIALRTAEAALPVRSIPPPMGWRACRTCPAMSWRAMSWCRSPIRKAWATPSRGGYQLNGTFKPS